MRAYRQGVHGHSYGLSEQIEGHNVDLEVKTIRSLHEYELKEQDMQGALKYKNVMLNQTQSLEKQLRDIYMNGCVKTKTT